jgi:hypothetical protein
MTSEEIKEGQTKARDAVGGWLAEIAYQFAVFNEREMKPARPFFILPTAATTTCAICGKPADKANDIFVFVHDVQSGVGIDRLEHPACAGGSENTHIRAVNDLRQLLNAAAPQEKP